MRLTGKSCLLACLLVCLISLRLQLDSNALIFTATSADFIASDLMHCMHEIMAQSSRKIWMSGILNAMPPKKKAKALAEQVQPEAQEATESPPTESSSSRSGRNFTYPKKFERTFFGEDETEDSESNETHAKSRSRTRPRSEKQREKEPEPEEVPSYLSEENLPAFWECSDEAREIGWGSETQQAFPGAVNADAMTDGEMSPITSEESWPILQDLLFGGRGVSEMMVSHI